MPPSSIDQPGCAERAGVPERRPVLQARPRKSLRDLQVQRVSSFSGAFASCPLHLRLSSSFPVVLSCLLAPACAFGADASGTEELERVIVSANRDRAAALPHRRLCHADRRRAGPRQSEADGLRSARNHAGRHRVAQRRSRRLHAAAHSRRGARPDSRADRRRQAQRSVLGRRRLQLRQPADRRLHAHRSAARTAVDVVGQPGDRRRRQHRHHRSRRTAARVLCRRRRRARLGHGAGTRRSRR